jgi:hypothetical protein
MDDNIGFAVGDESQDFSVGKSWELIELDFVDR